MNKKLLFKWQKFFTIKTRLTIWYILILTLVLISFSFYLYWNMERSMYREANLLLQTQAKQLLSELEAENNSINLPELRELATNGTLAAFYDKNGNQLNGPQIGNILPQHITLSNQDLLVRDNGEDWIILNVQVTQDGKNFGWLRLVRSMETEEHALQRLLTILLFAVPLTLLVASGGGYFLAWKALGPIDRITRTAKGIGRGKLSHRVGGPDSNDEVGRLASTFDEMLNRLEQSFTRQQQFTADASHELRTPIAVISAQAEQALNKEHSAREYRHTLEIIRQHAERMGYLVSQLLLLARSDAKEETLQKELLDMGELIEIVVEEMKEMAESKGVELSEEISGQNQLFSGDQSKLIQLLVNLVDNAIKFTQPGGKVTVSVIQEKDNFKLLVSDTGMGIPLDQQQQIFERFYRVEKARSWAAGGTGLGLAICRQIAEAHGGSISIESKPGKGSTFLADLPTGTASV